MSEAARILAGNLQTQHLASELVRQHNLPDLLGIVGWKWVLAARVLLSEKVGDRKRGKWPYFVAIARDLTEADREAAARRGGRPVAPTAAEIAACFANMED